jgi:hypothetical protein
LFQNELPKSLLILSCEFVESELFLLRLNFFGAKSLLLMGPILGVGLFNRVLREFTDLRELVNSLSTNFVEIGVLFFTHRIYKILMIV